MSGETPANLQTAWTLKSGVSRLQPLLRSFVGERVGFAEL